MTVLIAIKLATTAVSVALCAAILARDHALKANRLIAAFLFCNALWAGIELLLVRGVDASGALQLYRLMSLGWIPLGVLCMHASLTLSSMDDHPIARTIPFFYVSVLLILPLAVGTDLVIEDVVLTEMGWKTRFGAAFPVAYLLLAAPVVAILICWRGVMAAPGPGGRLQLARVVFFGLSSSLLSGTVTAVVFPLVGLPAMGITTSLIAAVGVFAASILHRYGHALISPEAFAREILDTLRDGVILIGEGGVIRDVNRAFLRLVGAREAEVVDGRLSDWIPDSGRTKEPTEGEPRLLDLRTRTGEAIPVVVSAPVACAGAGGRVGRAHLIRDRRETLTLQRQRIVSARLAAVGDLSRSITRSIEEPVEKAREELARLAIDWEGLLGSLGEPGPTEELGESAREGLELIEECLEGVDRIASIVREVGRFSAEGRREEQEVHALDEVVRRSIRIAGVRAPETVAIEAVLEPDVRVRCHRPRIERVVTNLIVNAIQSFEGLRGRPRLTVRVASRGSQALIEVEDEGCGIAPEALDRIFDPFFTTKPVGRGTGLGLPISHHTVKAHGGEMRMRSTVGEGTRVTVVLPRVETSSGTDGEDEKG